MTTPINSPFIEEKKYSLTSITSREVHEYQEKIKSFLLKKKNTHNLLI